MEDVRVTPPQLPSFLASHDQSHPPTLHMRGDTHGPRPCCHLGRTAVSNASSLGGRTFDATYLLGDLCDRYGWQPFNLDPFLKFV